MSNSAGRWMFAQSGKAHYFLSGEKKSLCNMVQANKCSDEGDVTADMCCSNCEKRLAKIEEEQDSYLNSGVKVSDLLNLIALWEDRAKTHSMLKPILNGCADGLKKLIEEKAQ